MFVFILAYFSMYKHTGSINIELQASVLCIWLWLTHWGRVRHICVSKLTIIGSDNGLSPDCRQAIIWTNAGLLLIGPLGTNFGEILIEILASSFKKMRLKVSSAKRPQTASSSPGGCGSHFKCVIFKCIVVITFKSISFMSYWLRK